MKEIKWSMQFTHLYKKRIAKDDWLKVRFKESIETFQYDKSLVNDHPLEGPMSGKRAFYISGDYRIVYLENDDHYVLVDVGTHEQVYRR